MTPAGAKAGPQLVSGVAAVPVEGVAAVPVEGVAEAPVEGVAAPLVAAPTGHGRSVR